MGLSTERYEALKTVSTRFLTEKDYGFKETEAAMAAVFGNDRSSIEAKAWTTYWSALEIAGEAMDRDEAYTVPPIPLLDGSMPDIEMADNNSNASESQPTLSNGLLNSDAADRQRERDERKRNGNQHGREKNPLGRSFDELMASAFIERLVINSAKQMKPDVLLYWNPDTVDEQPIDEEALFNNPDPYGIKDCEAEEDEEDESDITAPPLVIRRADVLTLEIEAYIDLSSSKLTQRFAPDQGSPEPVVVDAAKKPVKNTKTKWVEEDAEWDAEAW